MNEVPCTVCGEGGHHLSKCPSLLAPLQPGFPKMSGPPPGAGDEEDEKVTWLTQFCLPILLKSWPLRSYQKPL